MAVNFSQFTTVAANLLADIKQQILASSDWAHLQLTTGTQATTLSAAVSATGATSISTAATIPSGSYIVVGNGAANPEVRITNSVSGAGPYTVGFAKALVNTYASGAAVGVGSISKATTTRGAQMVVDVADAAVSNDHCQMAVYRTHDGTTAVDKLVRYFNWSQSSYASAADPLRVVVSAGVNHIYLSVDGPFPGESLNTNNNGYCGSGNLVLCDIEPYFPSTDTTPAVALVGSVANNTSTGDQTTVDQFIYVSRNAANTASWVRAACLTLVTLSPYASGSSHAPNTNATKLASDGNDYLWPYVIVESAAGLRGRLSRIFYAGSGNPTYVADQGETVGRVFAVGGINYTVVSNNGAHGGNNNAGLSPLGRSYTFRDILYAVPSP